MKTRNRSIAMGLGTLVITALGTGGVALMASPANAAPRPTGAALGTHGVALATSATATSDPVGENTTSESDSDQAAQDTACKDAGVDPAASNVQYDDQTGTCSLDGGGSGGDEN